MEIIIAAVVAAAAALIAAAIAANDNAKAAEIRQKAADRIGAINLPVLDKVVAQKLPPESLARYEKVTEAGAAESEVLGKYKTEVNAKGETDEDRAAYLRAQQMAEGVGASGRSAVLRQLAGRGLGNSGLSYALQNANAQSGANRASTAGVEEAGHARQRYMDVLGKYGNLASTMRGQELQKFRAEDDINMFNSRQQSDADRYNSQLAQQEYDNKMAKATAQSGAEAGVALGYERSAGAAQQTGAAVGSAAMTAGSAVGSYNAPRYDSYGNQLDSNGNIVRRASA